MIDSIYPSIGWCVLQVSLLAFVGIAFSLIASRRSSFTACVIVCHAALMCALLTGLAPFTLHRMFALETTLIPAQIDLKTTVVAHGRETDSSLKTSDKGVTTVPMFELRGLALVATTLVTGMDRFERRSGIGIQSVCWILLPLVLIGHIRLLMGIAFVVKIRRKAIPIADSELLSSVYELAARLECRTVPCVRECSLVWDAAVAGWIRPVLILPPAWRNWSADERQSVIAHELVHIARSDSLWRAMASVVLAMHFFNPLLHWLLRRVVLYQELSADATAAGAVGRPLYLRALASLAIQRDNQLTKDESAGLLPVFSGFLIRRIKMLHSKEGSRDMKSHHKRKLPSLLISAAFLATVMTALVARGIAQPPNDKPREATKAPKTGLDAVDKTVPANDESNKAKATIRGVSLPGGTGFSFTSPSKDKNAGPVSTSDMFHRAPLDPSTMGANNQTGMAVLRVRELLGRSEIKSYAPVLNAITSSSMASMLKLTAVPPVNFDSVEWIALRPVVKFTAETKEKKSQFMIGSGGLSFKLNQPVDLQKWFDQFSPDAPRHVIKGRTVFEVSSPALGPAPAYVWTADGTTIHVCNKEPGTPIEESNLVDLECVPAFDRAASSENSGTKHADPGNRAKWNATWNRIDTGLLSIVIAEADLSGLFSDLENRSDFQNEFATKAGEVLRAMRTRCTDSAFGLDIGNGNSLIGFKCRFTHSSRETALQSAQEIQALLKVATAELETLRSSVKDQEKTTDDEQRTICVCIEAIGTLNVSIDELDDGTAAVVVAQAMSFGTFVELATKFVQDDFADENK